MTRQVSLPLACVAFALVVLKSKPSTISVDDYIHSLRRSLRSPLELAKLNKTPGSFDNAHHWHELYKQSQQQLSQLELKVLKLEAQLQSASSITARKRKRSSSSNSAVATGQSKQARIEDIALPRWCSSRKDETIDSAILPGPPDMCISSDAMHARIALLRAISNLGKPYDTTHLSPNSGVANEVSSIFAACEAAVTILQNLFDGEESLNDCEAQDLIESCTIFGSLWTTAVRTVRHRLDQRHEGAQASLSTLCCFFRHILMMLHEHCAREASQRAKADTSQSNARVPDNQRQMTGHGVGSFGQQRDALGRLLAHMFQTITTTVPFSHQLFEPIACIYVNHLGLLLSHSVLGISEAGRAKLKSNPPSRLFDAVDCGSAPLRDAVELEGPCLTPLLPMLTSRLHERHCEPPSKVNERAKTYLQNTLLRGVFGSFGNDFIDTLKPLSAGCPQEPQEPIPCSKAPSTFVGQVWEQLGWDVLVDRIVAI